MNHHSRKMPSMHTADSNVGFSPYNEDTIVSLITEIFNKHVLLCYFQPVDLVYPPTPSTANDLTSVARHTFSASAHSCFTDLNISSRVISFLERIPHIAPRQYLSYPFYDSDSVLTCPEETGRLHVSRDPAGIDDDRSISENDSPMLFSSDVALVTMTRRNGRTVILDTEANTIRVFANYEKEPFNLIPKDRSDPQRNLFEFPDNTSHYRNYTAEPAEYFLKSWLKDIDLLRVIPWRDPMREFREARLSLVPPGKRETKIGEDGKTWEVEGSVDDGVASERELEKDQDDDEEVLEVKKVCLSVL